MHYDKITNSIKSNNNNLIYQPALSLIFFARLNLVLPSPYFSPFPLPLPNPSFYFIVPEDKGIEAENEWMDARSFKRMCVWEEEKLKSFSSQWIKQSEISEDGC